MLVKRYEPPGIDTPINTAGKPVMSICAFRDHPKFFKGQLFENFELVWGRNFFCNLIYLHTGQTSVIKSRAQTIINNLASLHVSEIVLFHDECYAFTTKYVPQLGIKVPFKSIHLFEYLLDYLKKNPTKIRKLGLKAAYQRSCSNRFNPEVDHFIDEIFPLIGVERVAREYDRLNALCCTAPQEQFGRSDLAKANLKKNIEDALQSGAELFVCICPMCFDTLKRPIRNAGMKRIFISDLCRVALGELTLDEVK